MSIATAALAQVRSSAMHGHGAAGSETSHGTTVAARTEAIGSAAETVPVETKPHWRPSEDEIVRAAITVILVALVAIIAIAAAAVFTMG